MKDLGVFRLTTENRNNNPTWHMILFLFFRFCLGGKSLTVSRCIVTLETSPRKLTGTQIVKNRSPRFLYVMMPSEEMKTDGQRLNTSCYQRPESHFVSITRVPFFWNRKSQKALRHSAETNDCNHCSTTVTQLLFWSWGTPPSWCMCLMSQSRDHAVILSSKI